MKSSVYALSDIQYCVVCICMFKIKVHVKNKE